MNLRNRIRKIEARIQPQDCFCGKTWVDLTYGKPLSELSVCPNCQDEYRRWQRLAAEAQSDLNLTDGATV